VFAASTLIGIVALTTLLLNIFNSAFGYVALENKIQPEQLARNGVPIEDMPKESLVFILEEHLSAGLMRRFESEMPWEERDQGKTYTTLF
jgi:phosphate transport system permease protein